MPLGTMLALLLMWFGISTPLVFVGAFFGFKAKIADPPTRTNEIPRQATRHAATPHATHRNTAHHHTTQLGLANPNPNPDQVPQQAWYMGAAFNVLMGGILPFGAIFIELFFIMTSVGLQP